MLSLKHFFALIVIMNVIVIMLFFGLGSKDPALTPEYSEGNQVYNDKDDFSKFL